MNWKPRQRYTAEFKAQAIALRRELAHLKMENDMLKCTIYGEAYREPPLWNHPTS
jgi:transposase-like protein